MCICIFLVMKEDMRMQITLVVASDTVSVGGACVWSSVSSRDPHFTVQSTGPVPTQCLSMHTGPTRPARSSLPLVFYIHSCMLSRGMFPLMLARPHLLPRITSDSDTMITTISCTHMGTRYLYNKAHGFFSYLKEWRYSFFRITSFHFQIYIMFVI